MKLITMKTVAVVILVIVVILVSVVMLVSVIMLQLCRYVTVVLQICMGNSMICSDIWHKYQE